MDHSNLSIPPAGGSVLRLWRPSLTTLLLLGIVLLVSAWPFLPSLEWLWNWWIESPEYSHGILVPVLSAFLIWVRRDQLAETPFNGSWAGVLLVAFACLVYWVGRMATLHVVDNVGYWFLLCGIALSMTGIKGFRVIALPMALLGLSIPLPAFFLNNISSTLQFWSSELGVMVIRFFGISVLLQGNVIDLGQYRLEVAEACSGLRYLFPLLTIGVLMGYLYYGAAWKRIVIALSSLPLTVIMNSIRIGSIGVMVDRWGPSLAEGFVHDFQGWAMFMLTGAIMLGLLVVLHRMGDDKLSWRDAFGIPPPAIRPPGTEVVSVGPTRPFLAAIAVVFAVAVLSEFAPAARDVFPEREAFVTFPDQVDGRAGHRMGMNPEYLDVLQLDDYLLSDYVGGDGVVVSLYMAYYKAQRTGQSVHSPKSCLPGGGWIMTEFGQHAVPGVAVAGHPLVVNRAVVELGNERQLVYYWFQQRGRVSTSEFAVKWYLLWDGLTRHRTDGALVRLTTPLPTGTSQADGDARLSAFAHAMASRLPDYVPN
jgi:exosortase D (VPLPA-CTERM-specific)